MAYPLCLCWLMTPKETSLEKSNGMSTSPTCPVTVLLGDSLIFKNFQDTSKEKVSVFHATVSKPQELLSQLLSTIFLWVWELRKQKPVNRHCCVSKDSYATSMCTFISHINCLFVWIIQCKQVCACNGLLYLIKKFLLVYWPQRKDLFVHCKSLIDLVCSANVGENFQSCFTTSD